MPNQPFYQPYQGAKNLNLGCGHFPMSGFINLDRPPIQGIRGVDVAFDLEKTPPLPFPKPNYFDLVLASHVLEHISNLIPLINEIWRVLKPGGHLCIVSPHCGSDDAFEDLTHARFFGPNSWMYFNRGVHEQGNHHGRYNSSVSARFQLVRQRMVLPSSSDPSPAKGFKERLKERLRKALRGWLVPELDNEQWQADRLRNSVGEIQTVLLKPLGEEG